MTKQQLQEELKSKLKAGIKPSQLKKSKSLDDLAPKNLQTEPLRRKSIEPLTNPNSLKKQLELAQSEISTLGLQVEISQRELTEFKVENTHLKEQSKLKQKELEDLRKLNEEINAELIQVKQELDESQQARFNNLQEGEKDRQKALTLKKELNETIEEASHELKVQDENLKIARQNYQREKNLREETERKLNRERLKRNSLTNSNSQPTEPFLINLKYALYALLTVWFFTKLISFKKARIKAQINQTWPT